MKPFRLLLLAAGVLAVLLAGAVALAFNASFQTWAARRALAGQPDVRISLGRLDAGLSRLEQQGAVLTLPALEAELPVLSAATSKQIALRRLVARGWTLDLSKMGAAANPQPSGTPAGAPAPTPAPPPPPGTPAPAAVAAQAFSGIFAHLQLPLDVSVEGLQLVGEVILPGTAGRMKVVLSGGGLGVGREGHFDLVANAELSDPKVSAVDVRGALVAAMDTPRTFTRLAGKLGVEARGTKFPQGLTLNADLSAARAPTGESYTVAVVRGTNEVLTVHADYPRGAARLDGQWKIDLRDDDLTPFALGVPLPKFTAVGEGKFDTDASFAAVRASGRLAATADQLQSVAPALGDLGALTVAADFDLAEHAGMFSVRRLEAAIGTTQPVATVRALQAFDFKPSSGELRATDANRELLGVVLHGVPLAWARSFLPGFELSGRDLRGELVATARGGGGSLRSTVPLKLGQVTLAQRGQLLLRDVGLEFHLSADRTPQGWQAEIAGLTARAGDEVLGTLDAKAGQLAGAAQPIKATGRLTARLPAILAQPAAAGLLALTGGEAAVDFVASLADQQSIEGKVALERLAATVDGKAVTLPTVYAQVRADLSPDGKLAFNVPLSIESSARKSDLTLVGRIGAGHDKSRAIDAQVSSSLLVLDDVKVFAALAPSAPAAPSASAAPAAGPAPAPAGPPWAGVHGTLALQLKRVVYSDTFEMSDIVGRMKIEAGMLQLESMQAGIGEQGKASISGSVTFDAQATHPFALAADMAVRQFDPGPLFRAMNGGQPATVEGKFDVTSKLASRARTLGALAVGAGGEFQLTSRGGVFRGLPVNVGNIVEKTSKWAELMASAGSMLGGLTGRKEYTDIANKAQAVAELGKGLNPIAYDQLSVVLSRDAALNTTLNDFTLIAPELRLSGSGTALHREGSTLLEDSLAMEFTLRARGRQGDLLKYLGVLEAEPDNLGYRGCSLPLKIGGTLGQPDASEVSSRLTSLTVEKSGLTDKASELFNRVFGGGK